MKVGKPKSKRVPVRLRHKIEKSSAAKQRKQRKEAKKNPQWRSRLKKDPGIPNLFPYKAKVLAEIEEGRRRKEEDAQRRREVAKAQRLGTSVEEVRQEADAVAAAATAEEDDDELLDDAEDDEEDEEMDTQDDSSNPMAALLASAQARAQTYTKDGEVEGITDEDDAEEDNEWDGIADETTTSAARPALPKQALADPIKAVSALVARMHATTDGIERLITHYHIPPITGVTASDFHTRFLVEVARKRGRLGRGGVPNLHSAALAVLGDVHDGRLELPAAAAAVESRRSGGGPVGKKGEVQIVSRMAEPFRLEGLWGDGEGKEQVDTGGQTDMVVES